MCDIFVFFFPVIHLFSEFWSRLDESYSRCNIHFHISLFPRIKNTFVSKLKKGPLEKCWEGTGGVTYQLAGIFFHVYNLCRRLFFGCKLPARICFGKGGWGLGIGVGILHCCGLNLDAHQNLNAWNRLQVLTNMFLTFTQLVYFHESKLYSGEHHQVSDTFNCFCLKRGFIVFRLV